MPASGFSAPPSGTGARAGRLSRPFSPRMGLRQNGPMPLPPLVKAMRHVEAAPLCFVPAVIMNAHARPSHVEDALRAGAHQVLVLPTSASTLYRRLDWLLNDDRPYELAGDHYVIAGMEQRLSLSHQRLTYTRLRRMGPFGTPLHRGEAKAAEPRPQPDASPALTRAAGN